MIALGSVVQDKVTGLKGVATVRIDQLGGPVTYVVESFSEEKGCGVVFATRFLESRLEVLDTSRAEESAG